jgi:hypothetical protein
MCAVETSRLNQSDWSSVIRFRFLEEERDGGILLIGTDIFPRIS